MFKTLLFILTLSSSQLMAQISHEVPHMELDMDGYEYRTLIQNQFQTFGAPTDELQPVLNMGMRNLQWLDTVNASRSADKKLELSTPETQVGIPIENPRQSNRQIILSQFAQLQNELPAAYKQILFSGDKLPAQPPVSDEEFLTSARKADKIYQAASRWLMQEPYLMWYGTYDQHDIRGYFFFSKIENLQQKLENFSSLDAATQEQYRFWLQTMCRNNNNSKEECKSIAANIGSGKGSAWAVYQRFFAGAKEQFDSNFVLQNPRSDVTWSSQNLNLMGVAFENPNNTEVLNWLKTNIEDEWRFGSWNLKLNFVSDGGHAFVVFERGATPHVDGLGGNKITMDAERNIQEYLTRWTIRHEYGHTLGFPDCYVEFFDTEKRVMINYQIDTNNLMCSRRGKIQQVHVDELKRNYLH